MKASVTNGEDNADFWTALGGQIKPGLDLVVTATVDLAPEVEAGPPVERYELGLTLDGAEEGEVAEIVGGEAADVAPGVSIRSPRGRSAVEEGGRFRVRARAGDEVVVESDAPLAGVVKEDGAVSPAKRSGK
jgi:hypothetical protein